MVLSVIGMHLTFNNCNIVSILEKYKPINVFPVKTINKNNYLEENYMSFNIFIYMTFDKTIFVSNIFVSFL